MKISRLFAGLLIVLLGVALILSNFDVLHLDWSYIFRLWPVLLIFAGISVLVANQKLRAVLYAVTAILVLVWIFSAASVGWGSFHGLFHGFARDVHHQEFTEDMTKGVKKGVLTINSGAGSFYINDTTSDLLYASTQSNVGDYYFDTSIDGPTENLELRLEGNDNHWNFGNTKNTVNIKLNNKPDWDVVLNVGACSGDLDLSPYIIKSAVVKAGASSIKIRLGDKADSTDLRLDTGASSLTVFVPSSSGCMIHDNAELSSKSFRDFEKTSDGDYRTSNFDVAKRKVFISIDAGISSIKVRRY